VELLKQLEGSGELVSNGWEVLQATPRTLKATGNLSALKCWLTRLGVWSLATRIR